MSAGHGIYSDHDDQSGIEHTGTEHKHLYNGTVHIYTYGNSRQPADRNYICMGSASGC
jgi:hypothetical protein